MKIQSKTYKDYYILIEGDEVDTTTLQQVITETIPNRIKLEQLHHYLTKGNHSYIQWIQTYLPKILNLKKNTEINDKGYWSHHQHETIKELKQSRIMKYSDITNLTDYIVMDVETTGLSDEDSIIQFSAIYYKDNKEVSFIDFLIKPSNFNNQLSMTVSDITGITMEQLSDKPMFKDYYKQIIDFLSNKVIVGHNILFDIGKVDREINLINEEPMTWLYIDTLEEIKELLPNMKRGSYKLETLKETLLSEEVTSLKSHNSLNDCKITNELFQYIQHNTKR